MRSKFESPGPCEDYMVGTRCMTVQVPDTAPEVHRINDEAAPSCELLPLLVALKPKERPLHPCGPKARTSCVDVGLSNYQSHVEIYLII